VSLPYPSIRLLRTVKRLTEPKLSLELPEALDRWDTLFNCIKSLANPPYQPLSLLLKACPLVDHLSLYDVVNTPGVTADLSHISSIAKIDGYLPADDGMKKALTGADIVIIPAGIPRK